jgi:hypothetical protein
MTLCPNTRAQRLFALWEFSCGMAPSIHPWQNGGFEMKMVSRTASSTCTCQLTAAAQLRITSRVPCDLAPESIGYAACRFIRSSSALRHSLTWQSYQLRLAKGGDRRTKYSRIVAPAFLMELPGNWAQVRLAISPAGVNVVEVRLSADYPKPPRHDQR